MRSCITACLTCHSICLQEEPRSLCQQIIIEMMRSWLDDWHGVTPEPG